MTEETIIGIDPHKNHSKIAIIEIGKTKSVIKALITEQLLPEKYRDARIISKVPSFNLIVRSFLLPSKNSKQAQEILKIQTKKFFSGPTETACIEKKCLKKIGKEFLWQAHLIDRKSVESQISKLSEQDIDPEILTSAVDAAAIFCLSRYTEHSNFLILCFETDSCFSVLISQGIAKEACTMPGVSEKFSATDKSTILAALKTHEKNLKESIPEVLVLGTVPENLQLAPHYTTKDPRYEKSTLKERQFAVAIGLALSAKEKINFRRGSLVSPKKLSKLKKNSFQFSILLLLALFLLFFIFQNLENRKKNEVLSKIEKLEKTLAIPSRPLGFEEKITNIAAKIEEIDRKPDLRGPDVSVNQALTLIETLLAASQTKQELQSIHYHIATPKKGKNISQRCVEIELGFDQMSLKKIDQIETLLKKSPRLKDLSWKSKDTQLLCKFNIYGALS